MDNNIIIIFESIKTIHELEQEFSKRFGWFRFKERKECKELKNKIIDKINSLYDDRWTIQYLYDLQKSLEAFYIILEDYFGQEMYLSEFNPDVESRVFQPMYFIDQKNKNHIITLDIVSNNITFTILDTTTGNTFSSSSTDEVQSSQKKIESVCKHCLITFIMRFLDNNKNLIDY